MSRFLSRRFQNLEAYTPGEQPQDMEYIKLNTNESPYPPSPEVFKRVQAEEIGKLQLYPDPEGKALREKLSKLYDVDIENIFLSNGSDEILHFAFLAFCEPKGSVRYPKVSYGFYSVYADLCGLSPKEIPLQEDFTIRPEDYFTGKGMVVIANPNAPTGICLSIEQVEKIIKNNLDDVVLIDEAYVDFGGTSVVELTKKYENLLVVQTFSKSRSMAGARLGFAIASKEIIADLNCIKYSTNPYNVNRLTLVAGEAAIDSNDYYMENCKKIIETREKTAKKLKEMGFLVLDSKANFLFAMHHIVKGEKIYEELKKKGVLVRYFGKETIEDFVRITIGTAEQMEVFLAKLQEVLAEEETHEKK